MKNTMSILLILTILCSCVFSCAIAEETETRASDYFTSYGTSISCAGGGGLNITFKAVGTNICDQLGVATYQVLKLGDDGSWDAVSGLLSGQTGSNVVSYTFGRYFQGVAGETYRIQVTFVCAIGNGMEHKSYTSGSVTAR